MDKESVLARIASNSNLPTPPMVTLRVLERASQPDCTIQEIGKLISHDPGLCGKMLKLVNSSLFSRLCNSKTTEAHLSIGVVSVPPEIAM